MSGDNAMKVVITNKIPQSAVDALRAEHDVVFYHDADDCITREACLEAVRGADIVVEASRAASSTRWVASTLR